MLGLPLTLPLPPFSLGLLPSKLVVLARSKTLKDCWFGGTSERGSSRTLAADLRRAKALGSFGMGVVVVVGRKGG